MHVRAEVPLPPEVPVRAFPEIVVVVEGHGESAEIADALARHLAASARSSRIERLDEIALGNRSLGPAAIVIRIDVRVLESLRPTWVTRPQTVCGPWGCTTQDRTTMSDVAVVDAEVVLEVSEGRSGRVLQELRLREREENADVIGMRLRAIARLRARVIAAVEPRSIVLDVEFEPVDDAEVRAALEAIRAGHPGQARRALERVLEHDGFASRDVEERAKILFDLGQARRLEARAEASLSAQERAQRIEEAAGAIRAAIRLDPRAPYARALEQIEAEREAAERMRALEEAALHNFALDRGEPTVPAPPSAYTSEGAPPGP